MPTREKKEQYWKKMMELLGTHDKVIVVGCDFVSSSQMAKIRVDLRKINATMLMGKNTLMRKVMVAFLKEHPNNSYVNLLPEVAGNVGFIFIKENMTEVAKIVKANNVPAAAKIGVVAECDVTVPPGGTGCDPGQTSWFQALNVPTKITKGQIEIISELKLIKKGEKVGASEAGLLAKLNIKPFTYGLVLKSVFDNGAVFDSAVLSITQADLTKKFATALTRLAAVSIGAGFPTTASLPHQLGNAVKRMLAITAETGYKFKYSAKWDKIFAMSPEELAKLAASSGGGGAAPAAGGKAAAAAAPVAKEEPAEVDMGGGADLFGGAGDKAGY